MSHELTFKVLLGIRNPRIRKQVLLAFQRDSRSWAIECCKCQYDAAKELICNDFDLIIIDCSSLGIHIWGFAGLFCEPGFPLLIAAKEKTDLEVLGDPYDCPTVTLITDSDSELAMITERAKSLLLSCGEAPIPVAGKQ